MRRRTFLHTAFGAAALFASRARGASVPNSVAALTLSGQPTTLAQSDITDLRSRMAGSLLQPGSADYDRTRRIWNGAFDRRPALIARCANSADVKLAVSFARSHQLLTAVRGGGHSLSGQSVCEGGLMIDLAPMKAVRVDVTKRSAWAEPGVLLGELDRSTQAHGLAVTTGTVTHTGVAGLTLGGGFGRLARRFGLTCDNLASVRIVTADGVERVANEHENQDLFWGVRGGGGNFGIVTSFEFRVHEVGPMVLGGTLLFPFARAAETLDAILDIAANASDELWLTPTLVRLPDGQLMVAAEACYCGPLEQGTQVLSPLRLMGKPVAGEITIRPYLEQQRGLDAVSVPGRHYYYKSGFVRHVTRALVDEVVHGFERAPACVTAVPFIHIGGAISRVKPEATACWNRLVQCDLLVQSDWSEPGESARNVESSRALWERFEPYTEGFYINTDTPDDARRLQATYGGNYPRLVELKRRYDPLNLFRLNANIPPAPVSDLTAYRD